jgi:ASCH domain
MEPVLTVRQPWASSIFRAGKNVENRRRRTHYRGRLWIHAGAFTHRDEADRWATKHDLWLPEEPLPRGFILGSVELVDCLDDSDSPWALPNHYHWILRAPMLLNRPIAHVGSLGLSWRRPPRGHQRRARRHRDSYP